MKTFYFLFIFCSVFFAGQSQVLENKIKKFTSENNIEIFWIYNYSCNYDFILGDCGSEEPHYLFWKQFDKWNIKRFDYCQTFKTIQKDSLDSLDFYLHYFNQVEETNLKLQTDNQIRKRNRRKKISNDVAPARFTCLYTFDYCSKWQLKKIVQDEYYLKSEKSNNNEETANPETELKSLILMTESLIKKLNDEGEFINE